jgi:hypothetical protein
MKETTKTPLQVEAEQKDFLKKEIIQLVSGHKQRPILQALDEVKQEVLRNASYRREIDQ